MKNLKLKIFLFLLPVLLLSLSPFKIEALKPLTTEERAKIIIQIELLQKEVNRLIQLIAKINLQKEISANAYLIADISNNSILLEKNINKLYPVASITKLMSSTIAIENINLEEKIILTERMLEPLGYSPSLFLGANIRGKDLLKASIIQSTNDASNSLTYFLKEEEFLNLMNKKAKELNMNNTVFYDSHGLNPLNTSNSSDLLKLLEYIYKNHPQILEISRDNNFWLPNNFGRMLKFKNVNNFYNHPLFIGGKTGYLIEARQTFASIFNIDQKPIVIIILYSNNRQLDTLKIIDFLNKNI